MYESATAFHVNNLLHVLAEHGVVTAPLLRRARIQAGTLKRPDLQIPIDKYFALIEHSHAAANIPALGLKVGVQVPIAAHGLLGYAILDAPTLGKALERFCRYGAHLSSLVHSRLSVEAGQAQVSLRLLRYFKVSDVVKRHMLLEYAGYMTRLADPVGLDSAWLDRVEIPFAPDGDEQAVAGLFLCPVLWNSDHLTLVFPETLLYCPIRTERLIIDKAFEQQYAYILEELRSGQPLIAEINRLITLRPSNLPNIAGMADLLGMSSRTLQRRLDEEGFSYREVIRRFRMTFARFYLENTNLPAAEIGLLVGYTEPVNFYRAFRRFFGLTPSQAREQGRNSIPA